MNNVTLKNEKVRESDIELLKIFAIFLVIVSHVVQTLGTNWISYVGYNDYCVNLKYATKDVTRFILIFLRHSGIFGNSIFFICSAWFLLDKNKTNTKKILRMICDIWVISVLWFIVTILIRDQRIGRSLMFDSFFPTLTQTNWYMTTYIIFCFVAPFLNIIIEKINQKNHFIMMFVMVFLYLTINFLDSYPYGSYLTIWITIYISIAYFKKYCQSFCNNMKANIILLIGAFLGYLCLLLLTNYLGLKNQFFMKMMLKWNKNANIFAILFCFASFNIFRKFRFKNRIINYISSLSMLIYLIHENHLFRTYFRPAIWQWIYLNFGYDHILLWVLLYVLFLFVTSSCIAILYKIILERPVHFVADKIHLCLNKALNLIYNFLNKNNEEIGGTHD